jgi:V/A-type H+-transporting ATPase subunit E
MTGLEKILKHIEDDAIATANASIAEAEKEAQAIISTAQAEIEKRRAEILEKAKQESESSLKRVESAALLKEKKMLLDAKQQVISNVITNAKNLLTAYSSEDYFKVVIKMVQKYALGQSGQIVFSNNDKKRLPEQFGQTLGQALLGTEGATLTISENSVNIDGGFILIYGDVEVNCSFDALFFAARESLQDKVCEILFV